MPLREFAHVDISDRAITLGAVHIDSSSSMDSAY